MTFIKQEPQAIQEVMDHNPLTDAELAQILDTVDDGYRRQYSAVQKGVSALLSAGFMSLGLFIGAHKASASESDKLNPGESLCVPVVGTPNDLAVVNITPVNAEGGGYGAIRSSDAPSNNSIAKPVSNVNFAKGTLDPNVGAAPIGSDGKICFDNSFHTRVDVVLDELFTIDAAAVERPAPSGALRVADTREGYPPEPPKGIVLQGYEGPDPILVSETEAYCSYKTFAGASFILQTYGFKYHGLLPDSDPTVGAGGDTVKTEYTVLDGLGRKVTLINTTSTTRDGVAEFSRSSGVDNLEKAKRFTTDSVVITKTPEDGSGPSSTTRFSLVDLLCTLDPAST